jgi:hypothetical protein
MNASVPALVKQALPAYDYRRYMHSVGLTHPSFQAAPAFRATQNRYYVGQSDVNSITINFYEDSKYTTHAWVATWRASIRNKRRQYSLPKQYKGSLDVAMLSGLVDGQSAEKLDYDDEYANSGVDSVGDSSISMTARVLGIFPTTQSPTDLDFSRTDRIVVPIEFQVDDVQYYVGGVRIE